MYTICTDIQFSVETVQLNTIFYLFILYYANRIEIEFVNSVTISFLVWCKYLLYFANASVETLLYHNANRSMITWFHNEIDSKYLHRKLSVRCLHNLNGQWPHTFWSIYNNLINFYRTIVKLLFEKFEYWYFCQLRSCRKLYGWYYLMKLLN